MPRGALDEEFPWKKSEHRKLRSIFRFFEGLVIFIAASFTFHNSQGLMFYVFSMHHRANFVPISQNFQHSHQPRMAQTEVLSSIVEACFQPLVHYPQRQDAAVPLASVSTIPPSPVSSIHCDRLKRKWAVQKNEPDSTFAFCMNTNRVNCILHGILTGTTPSLPVRHSLSFCSVSLVSSIPRRLGLTRSSTHFCTRRRFLQ